MDCPRVERKKGADQRERCYAHRFQREHEVLQ